MEILSRNQLDSTVTEVTVGNVMAEVPMQPDGGDEIAATITGRSAKRLRLKPGDRVVAFIQTTEVMVGKE